MAEPSSSPAPDCGDPPLAFGGFAGRRAGGGVPGLFSGRAAHWSYNTRVAIRAGCDLLGLRPGDEVLAPAYNCGSEIDPLVDAGLAVRLYPTPISAHVDPEAIAALIGPKTRAVYVIHYFGVLQPHLAAIRALCDEHGLRLIEDCALSLLSGQQPAEGRTGDISVFCFYKFFPVIGGGALVLNASGLGEADPFPRPAPAKTVAKSALRGVLPRLPFGRAVLNARARRAGAAAPEKAAGAGPETGPETGLEDMPGHYYFDPDLRGRRIAGLTARALAGFDIPGAIAARKANWRAYRERLDGVAGVTPLYPDLPEGACPLSLPLLIRNRDAAAQALQRQGIPATPWWAGYNRNVEWDNMGDAAALKDGVLSLPLHQYLGADHIAHICATLRPLL